MFGTAEPERHKIQFLTKDCSETSYGPCKYDSPSNATFPRGTGFTMRDFDDSDHTGDSVTRRSRTGFIVLLSSAPIFDHSKKQGSCET